MCRAGHRLGSPMDRRLGGDLGQQTPHGVATVAFQGTGFYPF